MKVNRPDLVEFVDPPPGYEGPTADTPDPRPVSPPSELTAEPFAEQQVQRWRDEVAKSPRGYAEWPDDDVLVLVGRFLATLDVARAAPQADAGTPSEWHRHVGTWCLVCVKHGAALAASSPAMANATWNKVTTDLAYRAPPATAGREE